MTNSTANLAFNNSYAGYNHATTNLRTKGLRKAALSLTTTAAVAISFANIQPDTNSIFVSKTFLATNSVSSWNILKSDKDVFLEKFPAVKNDLPTIYSTIQEVFGEAEITTSVYQDTEENWQNLLITINSSTANFDEMRGSKKRLFASFASQGIDAHVLKHITFSIE
ncbi:MAG: hypothetical protein ABL867_04120 [Rickettsiales bacterium]